MAETKVGSTCTCGGVCSIGDTDGDVDASEFESELSLQ